MKSLYSEVFAQLHSGRKIIKKNGEVAQMPLCKNFNTF